MPILALMLGWVLAGTLFLVVWIRELEAWRQIRDRAHDEGAEVDDAHRD